MSYNERLCKLRLNGKFNSVSLISICAPTEDTMDGIKEQFYEDLQKVTPESDTVIILGSLNARLVKEDAYRRVTGQYNCIKTQVEMENCYVNLQF
jgi:calcineurin-like phosphoesterase family protein